MIASNGMILMFVFVFIISKYNYVFCINLLISFINDYYVAAP